MAKRIFSLLLLFLMATTAAVAQSVGVVDFKLDEEDHTASDDGTKQTDDDGEWCAVIKVITDDMGFTFDVGGQDITEIDTTHSDQIWLYVPAGIKKILIMHPEYGMCIYPIPIVVEGLKTYRMPLKVNGIAKETDSQRLSFACVPSNATLWIDDKEVEMKDGRMEETYGVGVHSYLVEAKGYAPERGTITVTANDMAIKEVKLTKIVSEDGKNNTIDWNTQQPEEITVPGTDIRFVMIPIKPATYVMGATFDQTDIYDDEKPEHNCTVDGFFIGQTEVTQELWEAVTSKKPSRFTGKDMPVEQVSWNDCQMFISQLSRMTGRKFRMPTEAEWELAAKGGDKSVGSGSAVNRQNSAWYADNSEGSTHTTATKTPNAIGLYDMLGNVSEWCQDWYQGYTDSEADNPTGAKTGTHKVSRGGNWLDPGWNCRTTMREMNTPDVKSSTIGLRLAM